MTCVVEREAERDVGDSAAQIPSGRPWWGYLEEAVASLLLLAVLIVTTVGIFSRYVLGAPFAWTEPSARYLLIWLTMLGSVVLFKNRSHIEVDFLYRLMSPAIKRVLDLLVGMVQLGVGIYLLVFGWELASTTTAGTTVPGVTLAMVYLCVPISAVFIIGYALRDLATVARRRNEVP